MDKKVIMKLLDYIGYERRKKIEDKLREYAKEVSDGVIFMKGGREDCGSSEPHTPHYTSFYETVRYGTLGYFCLGKEGDEYEIVITSYIPGRAGDYGVAHGYWRKKKK